MSGIRRCGCTNCAPAGHALWFARAQYTDNGVRHQYRALPPSIPHHYLKDGYGAVRHGNRPQRQTDTRPKKQPKAAPNANNRPAGATTPGYARAFSAINRSTAAVSHPPSRPVPRYVWAGRLKARPATANEQPAFTHAPKRGFLPTSE